MAAMSGSPSVQLTPMPSGNPAASNRLAPRRPAPPRNFPTTGLFGATGGITGRNVFRVAVHSRIASLGIVNTSTTDLSEKLMYSEDNIFKVYMPCYKSALDDLHAFSNYTNPTTNQPFTTQDLQDALTLVNSGSDRKLIFTELQNMGLLQFLGEAMYKQYDRNDPTYSGHAYALTDQKTFWQWYDKNSKYSLGEIDAILGRAIFYENIHYKDDPKAGTFYLASKDASSGAETKLVSGQQDAKTHTLTLTLEKYPEGLALYFSNVLQIQQHTNSNVFDYHPTGNPTQDSATFLDSCKKDVTMILMAIGECNMYVPAAALAQIANNINALPTSQDKTDLLNIMAKVQPIGQIFGPGFKRREVVMNSNAQEISPNARHGLHTPALVQNLFRTWMNSNAAVLGITTLNLNLNIQTSRPTVSH